LIARALGGRVYPSAVKYTGWYSIHLQENVASDRGFEELEPVESVFHVHEDTFDLPPWGTYAG
jgi:GMP synthase-like glutamine amidotransferase